MTKTFLPIALVFFLTLSMIACKSNQPKVVAEKFLLSVAHSDLDEAKKYCDANTQELLEQANYLTLVPDSVKEEGRQLKIKIVGVKEQGDKAVVTYTTSKLDENQVITLVKVEGKWLVQLDKMQDFEDETMLPESNDMSLQDSTSQAATDSSNN